MRTPVLCPVCGAGFVDPLGEPNRRCDFCLTRFCSTCGGATSHTNDQLRAAHATCAACGCEAPARRGMTPADRLLAQVELTPYEIVGDPPAELYATHEGVLNIGEAQLRVYQLSDGRRVLDAEDIHRVFLPREAADA